MFNRERYGGLRARFNILPNHVWDSIRIVQQVTRNNSTFYRFVWVLFLSLHFYLPNIVNVIVQTSISQWWVGLIFRMEFKIKGKKHLKRKWIRLKSASGIFHIQQASIMKDSWNALKHLSADDMVGFKCILRVLNRSQILIKITKTHSHNCDNMYDCFDDCICFNFLSRNP